MNGAKWWEHFELVFAAVIAEPSMPPEAAKDIAADSADRALAAYLERFSMGGTKLGPEHACVGPGCVCEDRHA